MDTDAARCSHRKRKLSSYSTISSRDHMLNDNEQRQCHALTHPFTMTMTRPLPPFHHHHHAFFHSPSRLIVRVALALSYRPRPLISSSPPSCRPQPPAGFNESRRVLLVVLCVPQYIPSVSTFLPPFSRSDRSQRLSTRPSSHLSRHGMLVSPPRPFCSHSGHPGSLWTLPSTAVLPPESSSSF